MIDELVKQLADARQRAEQTRQTFLKVKAALEGTEPYQNMQRLGDVKKKINEMVASLEDEVRKVGLKEEHPALKPKDFDVVKVLDDSALREWCLKNFTPALRMDMSQIEDAAKKGLIPANLVEVTKETRVTIASDLSSYLSAEQLPF